MGCFRTADGFMNVGGASGRLLRNFCAVVGLPDLPKDPRFDSTANRSANRTELNAIIAARLVTRSTADWVEAFAEVGVPAGPVYRVDEALADPQVEHLGVVTEVDGSALGRIALVRNPVTSDHDITTVRTATPAAGQHTDEVLGELGLSTADIEALRARGVV